MTTNEELEVSKWYSLKPLLSRGCWLNFVIGERSSGKTYAAKEWALNDFMSAKKRGEQPPTWVYLRRNDEEINIAKRGLWDDFLPKLGYEVKTKGIECYIRRKTQGEEWVDLDGKTHKPEEDEWELFGYYLSISEGQDYKGRPFPHVNKVIFDEVIIENPRRRYIGNSEEVKLFLGILSTVFRRRKDVRIVCLSNSGAIANPYFQHYGVDSSHFKNTRWVKRFGGKVLFEYAESARTDDEINEDIIAQISGDDYIDYAFKNKFMDASEDMVAKKPSGATPYVKFTADGSLWFTIYKGGQASHYREWVEESNRPGAMGFSLRPGFVSEVARFDPKVLSQLKGKVDARELFFASADTRAKFLAEVGRN